MIDHCDGHISGDDFHLAELPYCTNVLKEESVFVHNQHVLNLEGARDHDHHDENDDDNDNDDNDDDHHDHDSDKDDDHNKDDNDDDDDDNDLADDMKI